MSRIGPAVLCEGLTVKYGSFTAVDRVTFDVQPGEVFGLLGPNGAGKTSVVRALTTILDPSAGRAEVAGIPLDRPGAVRGRIGVLPESNGYPGAETALDYLRFYGQLFGMPAAESAERGESLLRQFGLAANTNQLISTFSRGMRQRLGIARALVNDPQVLFLDEPTLGLDPAGREDVLSHLTSAVAANGAGVVLCSHHLDDVERVCDRVAILDRGRVVALGTVSDVIETAGIGSRMRIAVAPDGTGQALGRLLKLPQVARAESNLSRPGEIHVDLVEPEPHANQILSLLVGAGIEVRGVELQGARLSEAFLTLTHRELGQ